MSDTKEVIAELIRKSEQGIIPPDKAWNMIQGCKNAYVDQYSEQSWHSYVGHKFQKVVCSVLKGYFRRLKSDNPEFGSLQVLKESEVGKNDIIKRKLAIEYGDFLLLPDADIVVVDMDSNDVWQSKVLAIVSCKTSLRERIAQACYWKLKLLSSETTEEVLVLLATTDNDDDFMIKHTGRRYNGMHRNRIIAEHELDGVYIMRDDFQKEWESNHVKHYQKIFDDLAAEFERNQEPVTS